MKSRDSFLLKSSLLILILTGLILGGFFVKVILSETAFWDGPISYELSGLTGDFIGGVIGTLFSAGAFILMYLTLREQQDNTMKGEIESRFFRLLEFHRKNVEEMEFDASRQLFDPDTLFVDNKLHSGKMVFREVFKQVTTCRNELAPYFKKEDVVYDPGYLKCLRAKNYFKAFNSKDFCKMALIDISYDIVFFGVGPEGQSVLKKLLAGKYNIDFIERIIDYIALKPAEDIEKYERWKYIESRNDTRRRIAISQAIKQARNKQPFSTEFLAGKDNEIIQGFDSAYVKYYGGHQFQLGHYFRHLYQTVRYVNEQHCLTYKKKYEYIKLLRAQLSNYEQAILFFNSLSQLGRTWEITPVVNGECKGFNENDFHLITKYNLIKNLPCGSQLGIDPELFYPNVQYETSLPMKRSVIYH